MTDILGYARVSTNDQDVAGTQLPGKSLKLLIGSHYVRPTLRGEIYWPELTGSPAVDLEAVRWIFR